MPATLLRRTGHFELWSVGTGGLVQVVDTTTGIAADGSDLGRMTSGFLDSNLPGEGIYPTIAYAGQPAAPPTLPTGAAPTGPPGRVVAEDENLSSGVATAVVRANRTAVVLLKVSFDPGWSVSVDAKRAVPEMIAPALVGVRVTQGVHRVVFRFHGFGSYPVLFGVAVVTVLAVGVGPVVWRRRRRPRAS